VTINTYRKEEEETVTSTRENVELRADERALARTINILIKTLEEERLK